MNWRRGFFRAWVVFTVLWIIGAGAFAYGPLQTYLDVASQGIDGPTSYATPDLKRRFTDEELFRLENYSNEQLVTALRAADKKNDKKLARILANEIVRRREVAISVAKKRLRNDMWLERKAAKKQLEFAGTAAVSVPAAILALGAILAWVFKGFRQGKDNASP